MASTEESASSTEESAFSTEGSAEAVAAIAIAFPELCRRAPAIAEPLERLRQAAWEEFLGTLPTLNSAQLLVRAGVVFAERQAILAVHEGQRLRGALRREIWDAQELALIALPGTKKELKQVQLEVAAGRPLTICFGHRSRHTSLPSPFDRFVYPHGDGCGLVHTDSIGLRRPNFSGYCPHCRGRTTQLKDAAVVRARAASEGRFRVLVFDDQGRPVDAWSGRCSNGGHEFLATSPQARRCERCRRAHQGPPPPQPN
jgi:hypothetical protein